VRTTTGCRLRQNEIGRCYQYKSKCTLGMRQSDGSSQELDTVFNELSRDMYVAIDLLASIIAYSFIEKRLARLILHVLKACNRRAF
jgi:hypothetical protein